LIRLSDSAVIQPDRYSRHVSQNEWAEPRGPHLPDAITRIPLGVWPFLALAALEAFGRWEQLRSIQFAHPVDYVEALVGAIGGLAVPLTGAALFLRHPNAHRRLPSITAGVSLLAAVTIVDALRVPVLEGILRSDLDFETSLLASTVYSVIQALVRAFGVTYLAIGLEDARQFEDQTRASGVRALLLVGALGSPAITAFVVWPWPSEQVATTLLSIGAQVLTNLAWTYLAWTAYRGWAAGEEPHTGWALVVLVAAGNVVVSMLAAVLNLVVWAIGPTDSQVPVVFEAFRVLVAVIAGLWVALLAAFWLGLPAEPAEDVQGDGLPQPA
jgi:Co/Zn/Cd efflux system component